MWLKVRWRICGNRVFAPLPSGDGGRVWKRRKKKNKMAMRNKALYLTIPSCFLEGCSDIKNYEVIKVDCINKIGDSLTELSTLFNQTWFFTSTLIWYFKIGIKLGFPLEVDFLEGWCLQSWLCWLWNRVIIWNIFFLNICFVGRLY